MASIHRGTALNVWETFARQSAAEDINFFIFPGGRLNSSLDSDYLRNSVYSLVNPQNLDGIISWSSTIGYTVPEEEFQRFHKEFEPLPLVTISWKAQGHPCVSFDAYNGIKSLVNHLIRKHGARRIAFLRGPLYHQSTADRLRGYCDALNDNKIPISLDSSLISDPFDWNYGTAAAAQLYETRGLVPGKDFDALVGASDLMVLAAIQYFQKKGFRVPGDYLAGGFNNSAESRIPQSRLSTVHMPYNELSNESFKILHQLMEKGEEKTKVKDLLLPMEVIIRESCGCNSFGNILDSHAHKIDLDKNESKEAALVNLAGQVLSLNEEDKNAMIVPLVEALEGNDQQQFFRLFERALVSFFKSKKDIDVLFNIFSEVRKSSFLDMEKLMRIEPLVFRMVARMQESTYAFEEFQTQKWHSVLNTLKCEMFGIRDRRSLIHILARHLPAIGITTSAIMLYIDERTTQCMGSFSSDGMNPESDYNFSSVRLFPENIGNYFSQGMFMVLPLFIENQSLGYIIFNIPFYDGVIFEELRQTVSNALRGIFLFEETLSLKMTAEKAEQTKTEFFITAGNSLSDFLSGMAESLDTLEAGHGAGSSWKETLDSFKSRIIKQREQTNKLIDLSLSQIDEFSFRKKLFNIHELLPELGYFPLLTGDPVYLFQAFSIIKEECGTHVSARMGRFELVLEFKAAEPLPQSLWSKQSLLLAERIILRHGGDFQVDESACTVHLPWLTLSGQLPVKKKTSAGTLVFSVSDPPPLIPEIGNYEIVYANRANQDFSIPNDTACIAWDADRASTEEFIFVARLRSQADALTIPFFCYSSKLEGETLIDAVDAHIQKPKEGVVLFIGQPAHFPGNWVSADMAVHINSMNQFTDAVSLIAPVLIVLDALDIEAVENIRRHPATVMVPLIVLPEKIESAPDVMNLCRFSRLILCNRCVAAAPEFAERVKDIIAGKEILPSHTGALVKKAVLYFNQHVESHISRWKLADSINVSEDYLTRIFHRELGLPLWDYLNRYRVFIASELLKHTDGTIYEISEQTGFQDQAYFCRVFKKITGMSPGQLRKK